MGQAAAILVKLDLPGEALAARKLLNGKASPELARAVIELNALRQRAVSKMPNSASMLLTRKGLEQATDGRVCAWRAREIARILPNLPVHDATAGIGAESLALAAVGLKLISSDLDPVHAGCCEFNLASSGFQSRVLIADARFPILADCTLLLDPDRRAKAGNSQGGQQGGFASRLDPAAWSPPLSDVARVLARSSAGCVKLPPGVDPDEIEALLDAAAPELPRRFTWTESGGDLRELCLWTGQLAPDTEPRRLAVRILGGPLGSYEQDIRVETLAGDAGGSTDELAMDPELCCADDLELKWLVEPRASVIRAGLIGSLARSLAMAPIDPFMAYLGCTERDAAPLHPLAKTYRVLAGAPLDKKRVRSMLRAH
ncbi:MAG: hypothetical protein ACJAVJ_001887, partial [Planctomycetota bacterium]